mgnify:CR=1 FL=1
MKKIFSLMKWGLTLGKERQNFLGAKWIGKFLEKVPASKKRIWALRFVSMSPHYFVTELPEYRKMSNREVLEASFESCKESRINIFELLLKPHFEQTNVVLDYGCGPGFIAKVASGYVSKVYAIDISSGAIACAKVINPADNIEYLTADETGLNKIEEETIDAVYSYAVVQHLTDEVLGIVLENCRRKLKKGGKILLHIQLPNEVWKTENDWKQDSSLKGKIKFNYGLHCFGRSIQEYSEILEKYGFGEFQIQEFIGFDPMYDEELKFQRLLIAKKNN